MVIHNISNRLSCFRYEISKKKKDIKMKISVIYPIGSDIRLVHLSAGAEPSTEPLLSHAGLAWEEGGLVSAAPGGLKDVSDKKRQFLTSVWNDMTPELLDVMVERLNDPVRYQLSDAPGAGRAKTICEDLEKIPDVDDLDLPFDDAAVPVESFGLSFDGSPDP